MLKRKIAVWALSEDDTPIYLSTDGKQGHISIGNKALFNHLEDWLEIVGTYSPVTNASIFNTPAPEHLASVFSNVFHISISIPELDFWTNMAGINVGDPNEIVSRRFSGEEIEWHTIFNTFVRFQHCYEQAITLFDDTFNMVEEKLHSAINVLSKPAVRLYPKGDVQDTLVFCQRFPGLHYSSLLSESHLPNNEPQQDPRLLRRLRENLKSNIEEISIPTLCEVTVLKESHLLDVPKGHKTWMSISQLKAFMDILGDKSFELVDCWVFAEYEKITAPFFLNGSNWLSVTYGCAISQSVQTLAKKTWFAAYLMAEEKAFWVRLIRELERKFDVTVTGYGGGALSFYCWNGELSKVCEYLRRRAAVLKHWDREIELNILEMSNAESGVLDMEDGEYEDNTFVNMSGVSR